MSVLVGLVVFVEDTSYNHFRDEMARTNAVFSETERSIRAELQELRRDIETAIAREANR